MKNNAVVVAGNGPSLKNIDYRRLPDNFDVFRVNLFYKEEKYYLGKNVTAYFAGALGGVYEYFPIVLAQNIESKYNILKYYTPHIDIKNHYHFINFEEYHWHNNDYGKIILNYMNSYKEYYYNIDSYFGINSGLLMLAEAVMLGYKNIYVVGIELQDIFNWDYAFNDKHKSNDNYLSFYKKHHGSSNTDYDFMRFIYSIPDINIYSVSDTSNINKVLELAPIQNNTPYTPKEKKKSDMELTEQGNNFVKYRINKIEHDWPKSMLFYYKDNRDDMSFNEFENEYNRLLLDERIEKERQEKLEKDILEHQQKIINKINKIVWWIPIKKLRNKLRDFLKTKLK